MKPREIELQVIHCEEISLNCLTKMEKQTFFEAFMKRVGQLKAAEEEKKKQDKKK